MLRFPKSSLLRASARKGNGPTQRKKNSHQGGIRTHDLRILINVAPKAALQGQNRRSTTWVLQMSFHGFTEKQVTQRYYHRVLSYLQIQGNSGKTNNLVEVPQQLTCSKAIHA